jgi:quercetin dioxygenase-like cupin family protein
MRDTSITKVDSAFSPIGAMGQRYLAAGLHVSMRLWEEEPPSMSAATAHTRRDYEVVGYVLSGRAELEIEGQTVLLKPGDSYTVPRGALHKYTVLETFSAVEATAPPAFVHARDERNVSSSSLPQSSSDADVDEL